MITLTRRPLSVSRALHVLSFCVLCLAPPAVDLLKALGRCVCTRGLLLLLSANIALLMLPLSFFLGVGASSLSLAGLMFKATRRGSFSLLFAVASAARAYATGLPHLFAYVGTSAASDELLPRGLRAVCFPRWLHVLSCSTWLIIVRCCIGGLCYFASLALTVILNSIRRAASSGC